MKILALFNYLFFHNIIRAASNWREWIISAIESIFRSIMVIFLSFGKAVADFIDGLALSNPTPCSTGELELSCSAQPAYFPVDYQNGEVVIGISQSELQSSTEVQNAVSSSSTYQELYNSLESYNYSDTEGLVSITRASEVGVDSVSYDMFVNQVASDGGFWNTAAQVHVGIVSLSILLLTLSVALAYSGKAIGWGVDTNDMKDLKPVILAKTFLAIILWWPLATAAMQFFELITKTVLLLSTSFSGNNLALVEGITQSYQNLDGTEIVEIDGREYAIPTDSSTSASRMLLNDGEVQVAGESYDPQEEDWIERKDYGNVSGGDFIDEITGSGGFFNIDWEQGIEEGDISESQVADIVGIGNNDASSSLMVSTTLEYVKDAIDSGMWQVSLSFLALMVITGIPYLLISLGVLLFWLMRVIALIILTIIMPLLFATSKLKVKGLKTLSRPSERFIKLFGFLLVISLPVTVVAGIYAFLLGSMVEMFWGSPEGIVESTTSSDGYTLIQEIRIGILLFFVMWGPIVYGLAPFFLAKYSSYDPASHKGSSKGGLFEQYTEDFFDLYNKARSRNETKDTLKKQHQSKGVLGDVEYTMSRTEDQLQKVQDKAFTPLDKSKEKARKPAKGIASSITGVIPSGGGVREKIKEKADIKEEAAKSEASSFGIDYEGRGIETGSREGLSRREQNIMERKRRREQEQQEKEKRLEEQEQFFEEITNFNKETERLSIWGEDLSGEEVKDRVDDKAWKSIGFKDIAQASSKEEFYDIVQNGVIGAIQSNNLSMEEIEEIFPNIDEAIDENVDDKTIKELDRLDIYEDKEDLDTKTKLSAVNLLGDTVKDLLDSGEIELSDKFDDEVKDYASKAQFVNYEMEGELIGDIDEDREKTLEEETDPLDNIVREHLGGELEDIQELEEEDIENIAEGVSKEIEYHQNVASEISEIRSKAKVDIASNFMETTVDKIDTKMKELVENSDLDNEAAWEKILEEEEYMEMLYNVSKNINSEEVMDDVIEIVEMTIKEKEDLDKEAWNEVMSQVHSDINTKVEESNYDDKIIEELLNYVNEEELETLQEENIENIEEFKEKYSRKELEEHLENIGIENNAEVETINSIINDYTTPENKEIVENYLKQEHNLTEDNIKKLLEIGKRFKDKK